MTTKKSRRLTFACHNHSCGKAFSLLWEQDVWVREVNCPYCGEVCVLDLTPHRGKVDLIFQSDAPAATFDSFNLPDIIPTKAKEA